MREKNTSLMLTAYLGEFITAHKKEYIEKILAVRTRYITLAMEDIYQTQNASAVLRSCECYGIQDVHIIENENPYEFNKRVLKGSTKWLHVHRYKEKETNNTASCFESLRSNGYRILATSPGKDSIAVEDIPFDKKISIVLGNELHGLSAYALEHADAKIRIPMFGFTESLNLSACAAICLNVMRSRLHNTELPWQLSEEEKAALRLEWYRKLVKNVELVEKKFLQSNTHSKNS